MTDRIRTVLVTGASGGIGRATVELFHQNGWRVIGVDLNSSGEAYPRDGLFIQADLCQPDQVEGLYRQAANFTKTLAAVVHIAGVQVAKPLVETSLDEWDWVMAANLRAVFQSSRLAFPLLKANGGGAIVNVSSVHAVATSANIAAYAASKGGLLALTRAAAIEFAPAHIRVNAVLPGAVDTPMLRAGLDRGHLMGGSVDEQMKNLAQKTVIGRIGKPEEIARAINFLADEDQSSFMTGQGMIIDGGATARLSTE